MLGIHEVVLIWLLFSHWVADFCCQTNEMAQNKSKSLYWLSMHIATYTIVLFIMTFSWQIALINGLLHFVIDFGTSKGTAYLWKKGDVHNFFVLIGFDQFLHLSILILSYFYFI